MGFNSINLLHGLSPYSAFDYLGKVLPLTMDASRSNNQKWQSKFHSIKEILQPDKPVFYIPKVHRDASVDIDEENDHQIHLGGRAADGFNGAETSHFIDISLKDALAATNSADICSACGLIELAINAGCLSIVVCQNPYRPGKEQRRSMLFGYPIIDTNALLACVEVREFLLDLV